jgi:hypothetical protein
MAEALLKAKKARLSEEQKNNPNAKPGSASAMNRV